MAKKEKEPTTKEEALELALASIQKRLGKGAVRVGIGSVPGVEYYDSGCLSLNKALGGGWAKGRIVEVFGPEASGKTTLTLHAIAAAQEAGLKCAFIDVEHAIDPKYAGAIGVKFDELIFAQPNSGEEALQILETLTKSGALSIIVVDSVAALTPKAELEGEIGDSHMGRQARLMGQAMRMITAAAHNTNTTIMFINQIRMKLGIMFGSPETTSGGNALKFYASQRVDVRRKAGIKEGDKMVANETKAKVVKNKTADPFQEAEFVIRYGQGIDKLDDLVTLAVNQGIIDRGGAGHYRYKGEPLCQGKPALFQRLTDDLDFIKEIKDQLV